jgi:hypothetical protein
MTDTTAQELVARLMQHVEATMCDADVDFPAGHRAGARVSYDSDSLQTYFESELADALAREAALRESMEWQLIETAPKDGREILVWSEGYVSCYLAICDKTGWWTPDYKPQEWTELINSPTHWMPLPAAPEVNQ